MFDSSERSTAEAVLVSAATTLAKKKRKKRKRNNNFGISNAMRFLTQVVPKRLSKQTSHIGGERGSRPRRAHPWRPRGAGGAARCVRPGAASRLAADRCRALLSLPATPPAECPRGPAGALTPPAPGPPRRPFAGSLPRRGRGHTWTRRTRRPARAPPARRSFLPAPVNFNIALESPGPTSSFARAAPAPRGRRPDDHPETGPGPQGAHGADPRHWERASGINWRLIYGRWSWGPPALAHHVHVPQRH